MGLMVGFGVCWVCLGRGWVSTFFLLWQLFLSFIFPSLRGLLCFFFFLVVLMGGEGGGGGVDCFLTVVARFAFDCLVCETKILWVFLFLFWFKC